MPQLQGSVSFDPIASSDNFKNAPTEAQADAASRWFDDHLAKSGAPAAALSDAKQRFLTDYVPKYVPIGNAPSYNPEPVKMTGLSGVANAGLGYLKGVGQQIGQIPAALGAEANQFTHDPSAGLKAYAATGSGLAQGVRDLGQFPADLVNGAASAWMGAPYDPKNAAYTLPNVKDIPFVGKALDQNMQDHPVFSTVGNMVGGYMPVAEALGLGRLGKTKKAPPRLYGRVATRELPKPVTGDYGMNTRLLRGNPEEIQIGQIQRNTTQVIKDAATHTGIDEATTARERMKALKNAHDHYEELGKKTENPRVKKALQKAQADLQAAHASHNYKALLKEERATQGRLKKMENEARKLKDHKAKQMVKDQLALERAESKNRQRELNQLKASMQEHARVQDLQAKQAAASDKTLNKAERESQQRAAKQLQAAIKERLSEQKAQAEQQNGPKQQPKEDKQPGQQAPEQGKGKNKAVDQTTASKLKQIRAAIDNKHGLKLEYEAEKSGETGSYRHKTISPYQVEVNKSGVIQVRAINDEGQIRTYLLGDTSGSKIVSAESTGEPSPHEAVNHPETGKLTARVREGAEVAQVKKTGVKSSEIRANLAKMKAVLDATSPSVNDIMEAAKGLDDAEVEEAMKDVPKEKLDEVCKRVRHGL